MAVALAGAGADLALVGRSIPDLEETAHAVEALGRKTLVAPTDVAAYSEVEALAHRTLEVFGRIDILLNSSGIAIVKPLVETSPEEWAQVLNTNLTGTFNLCRAAGPHLIAQRRGKVINVASMLVERGLPGYVTYCASKGGIVTFTRTLAVEWARHNVQVNAIAPGWYITDMSAHAFADPKIRERLLRDVPMRRTGKPEELGPLVVYLASSASDFMTGQTIFLDGGQAVA